MVILKDLKRNGLLSFPVLLQQSFNIRWALILEHGNTFVISPKTIPSRVFLYFSIASSSIFLLGIYLWRELCPNSDNGTFSLVVIGAFF
jgi:hypothetical protein